MDSGSLQQHLTKSDRLLAYKLEDTWQKGRFRIAPNQIKDEAFITASRQFLTVNTPLKDLMFRHTRDTLRQYYKLGVLEEDVPVREVWDNAVVLESTREAELYRAVSDYVRHFYRLAQKENRKALGFLMTLYRKRLTSSFYAIEQSLSRRLNDLQTGQQTSLTPWNPMRVEQRIGRIDRIGQRYPTVRIHNFYYDGTVEAKVYRKLRDRIDAFSTVVGKLQPILAKVPTFIERALNSADPEEEDVLLSEFETVLETPPLRPAMPLAHGDVPDEMVEMDVQADLAITRQPMPLAPLSIDEIETLLTTSKLLRSQGFKFEQVDHDVWKLNDHDQHYLTTFNPAKYEEQPSLRLMLPGDPLLEKLLAQVLFQHS